MKKGLLVLSIIFALSFNVNANQLNLNLEADCEGYSIAGAVDNFCWYWHSGDCLKYTIDVVHKDGAFTVEGTVDLIYEGSSMWECPSITIDESGQWGEELCGIVSVDATVVMFHQCLSWVEESVSFSNEFYCPCEVGCNRTPGYWKNDKKPWPVIEITIGTEGEACATTYSRAEADAFMEMPVEDDMTLTIFRALVAAKLNVLAGSSDDCIADIILAADAWMCDYGPVGSGVAAGGADSPWRTGEALYIELDKYNNGMLCVPHCD